MDSKEEDCEEDIIDLELDLIISLEKITKEMKNNKSLEETLVKNNSQ
jgi:hypothetical protein